MHEQDLPTTFHHAPSQDLRVCAFCAGKAKGMAEFAQLLSCRAERAETLRWVADSKLDAYEVSAMKYDCCVCLADFL